MSKTHITKPWITTIFVLLLIIGLIVTWVLVGEFNKLFQQWLIAKNGVLWSGKITTDNLPWLKQTFGGYMDDASTLDNNVGQNGAIASNQLIFNPLILIPTLGCLVLSVIIPLIFKPFHVMNIDVLPYSATSAFSMFILIITGLIPHWSGGDVWLWVIRFLILLVCICGTFIITNRIVNKILANTNYASAVVNEFNKIEADKKPYRSSLKKLSEEANEKDKMKYVEEE